MFDKFVENLFFDFNSFFTAIFIVFILFLMVSLLIVNGQKPYIDECEKRGGILVKTINSEFSYECVKLERVK